MSRSEKVILARLVMKCFPFMEGADKIPGPQEPATGAALNPGTIFTHSYSSNIRI
jgi:hypothetical protein